MAPGAQRDEAAVDVEVGHGGVEVVDHMRSSGDGGVGGGSGGGVRGAIGGGVGEEVEEEGRQVVAAARAEFGGEVEGPVLLVFELEGVFEDGAAVAAGVSVAGLVVGWLVEGARGSRLHQLRGQDVFFPVFDASFDAGLAPVIHNVGGGWVIFDGTIRTD